MMKTPLNISMMLERAEMFFPKKQVISRMKGGIVRHTYKEIGERTRRLSSVLKRIGVEVGDRVGTFAWNHHRHLEAYFAIPGIGAVLHTINIRLSPQHIAYIINHADDRVLLIDDDLLPAIEVIKDEIPNVRAFIVMTDADELPETKLSPVYHYEKLLAEGDPAFPFLKDLDEYQPAGMCYTSATTGNPKGLCIRTAALSCTRWR
ncbi:Long-chain-fatty-acid--CoA ligase [Geobacillus sp. BCO2]|nr:Long-chain-fatty-acid--CoA ligase [Geobacillus sp. BCO2]